MINHKTINFINAPLFLDNGERRERRLKLLSQFKKTVVYLELIWKMRPLLPSLREKKRYVVFEIITNKKINDFRQVSNAIWSSALKFLGELETSKAGIWVLADKWNAEKQKGIIRVNNKYVDKLKASLAMITKIKMQKAIVKSVGISGILNKAERFYG